PVDCFFVRGQIRKSPIFTHFGIYRLPTGIFIVDCLCCGIEQDGAPQCAKNSPVDCFFVRGQIRKSPIFTHFGIDRLPTGIFILEHEKEAKYRPCLAYKNDRYINMKESIQPQGRFLNPPSQSITAAITKAVFGQVDFFNLFRLNLIKSYLQIHKSCDILLT
ncbi:MAG: hypothetical protein Q4E21_04925, partial [Clostridia bacterium]|nr:hypothetical protein [Clostridia bacterium]